MKSLKSIVGDRGMWTVDRFTTVKEAARLMAEKHIGAVPVLEGDRLVGIFTERDVLNRIVAAGLNPENTAVGDVMSTGLVASELTETYEACMRRMQQAHVRHVIVLDRGRLAGIVSLRDLHAADIAEKEEAITLLNAYVHYIPADLTQSEKLKLKT
jgi:predicted transcriptional regulator